jgi:malonate transporter and related proteins
MLDVINLALPFFGLVLVGFVAGRLKRLPDAGLAWMNFFIFYISLPAMLFRMLSATPFGHLIRPPFIAATTLATFLAFAGSFAIAMMIRRGQIAESTIAGLAGGYGNIGYMGPPLAVATLGALAGAPAALIFCFDQFLLFSLVPVLMALSGREKKGAVATAVDVVRRIVTHPLLVASVVGIAAAAVRFESPPALDRLLGLLQNAAAPCALFALGVTVALRPLDRMPWEVPFLLLVKLVLHPIIMIVCLTVFGPFDPVWAGTAVLMAALPPALNVYVFATQYQAWVPQASSSVMIGTLVSVLTLTTAMWIVKAGHLPLVGP